MTVRQTDRSGHRLLALCLALGGGLALLAAAAPQAQAADPAPAAPGAALLKPQGPSLVVTPPLRDQDESTNISGADCALIRGSSAACLLIADEGRAARLFTLAGNIMIPGSPVTLLPTEENGVKFDEIDGEAVAYDDGFYYVAGSYGLSRDQASYEKSRYFIFRFPVSPTTGILPFSLVEGVPDKAVERSERLADIIAAVPELKAHFRKPLEQNAVEMEGLAVQGKTLILGFRGPVLDGKAFAVKVAVDAVFGSATPKPEVFRLPLGPGIGVRDMAAVKDGFLILSGPQVGRSPIAGVFFWDGANRVEQLGELAGPSVGKAKPETLVVLKEDGQSYHVLVLFDGQENGTPTPYRIPKATGIAR